MTEKTDKQKAIFAKIAELKDRLEDFKCEMTQLDDACEQLGQERDTAIQKIETLQTFNEKWQRDYEALLISRTAAIEQAKQWERECDEWRERRDLAIVRAEEAEEREDAYLDRAEKAELALAEQKERARVGRLHAMETKGKLLEALSQAKDIAEEVISILADDHDIESGCPFDGATGKDMGCLACMAQERLADIKSLSPKSIGKDTTESRLRKALALYANPDNWRFSHDKDNNLLWITSLGPDYAIEILNEVSRESSKEKEKETAHALP